MNLSKLAGLVALVAICCALSACRTTVRYTNTGGTVVAAKKHGPPPHAPAHGYRHKHGNMVLMYDSGLRVYVVSGWTNHYFHKDRYYRVTKSGWQVTKKFGGSWKSVSTSKLPKGLRHTVYVKSKKKRK